MEKPTEKQTSEEKPVEKKAEKTEKPVQKTFVPKMETSTAPRAPRYFRNGQVQGEYVAKPGAENATGATYRPQTGERPQRVQTGARPVTAQNKTPRVNVSMPISAPAMPSRDVKSFSSAAKKKTFEKTYTEKKTPNKRDLAYEFGIGIRRTFRLASFR